MARAWTHRNDDWGVSALWYLTMLMAGGACFFLVLHTIYRPTVIPNPGLAAYNPPPGTRLLPLPGKHDAPILAALPDVAPDPSTALAQASPDDKPAKRDAHSRKHQRVARDRGDVQRSNDPYRWRNNGPDWQVASRPWF